MHVSVPTQAHPPLYSALFKGLFSETLATLFHLVTTSFSIPVLVWSPLEGHSSQYPIGQPFQDENCWKPSLCASLVGLLSPFLSYAFSILHILSLSHSLLYPRLSSIPLSFLSEYYCMDQAAFELTIPFLRRLNVGVKVSTLSISVISIFSLHKEWILPSLNKIFKRFYPCVCSTTHKCFALFPSIPSDTIDTILGAFWLSSIYICLSFVFRSLAALSNSSSGFYIKRGLYFTFTGPK